MRSLGSVQRTKHHSSDEIEKNDIDEACSMYRGEEGFGKGDLKARNHLEDLGVDGG